MILAAYAQATGAAPVAQTAQIIGNVGLALLIVVPGLAIVLYGWRVVLPRRRWQRDRATPVECGKVYPELDDFWDETSDDEPEDPGFGQTAGSRWFVTYIVDFDDSRGRAVGQEGWAGRRSFFIWYSVCSPTLKNDLPGRLRDQLASALVQERFDAIGALGHLQDWLDALGPLPPDIMVERLKARLYIPRGI